MKKILMMLSVFCLVLGVSIASATSLPTIIKNKVIKVGMAPEYIPFEFKNAKGEIKGFDYELAKKLADELEVKLQIKQYKWSELIPALKKGEIDIIISGMTRTLKRAREINFTDSYFETGQVVIVPSALSEKNTDVKTCDFTNVGVVKNTTGEQAAKRKFPKCNIIGFEDEMKATDALLNNKIEAFVFDRPLAEHLVRKNSQKLNTLLGQLSTEYYSFAIKQGDIDLLLWLNYFISEIKTNGTYSDLYNYWFVDREWEK